ncbi:pseudouridine synthase pus4 [Coemansia spiralis]|uniref:tRNA pseudouridine(55) synthase n=1 Tax=Coemansia spiralis TaxID=417178 RepID=A0A9W8GQL4_9FUNG|nr:pseudouridine synthase pus4 [Coemansia spiralis]
MLRAAQDVAAKQAAMRLYNGDASTLHGIFAVNKPPGISCAGLLDYFKRNITKGSSSMSFSEHFDRERALRARSDIINKKARRRFVPSNIRVGHGGTLDVEAAGVLVFGINHGCKQLSEYLVGGKSYLATGLLGVATESYDAEGNVSHLADTAIAGARIQEAIPQFIGDIMQRPPIYSAIKLDGKRLYEYARGGENIPAEVLPRKVTVSDVKLLYYENQDTGEKIGRRVMLPADHAHYYATGKYEWHHQLADRPVVGQPLLPFANQPTASKFQLLINSGGGVYVRSLIHDLGQAVGSAATMVSLVRTSQGPLRLDRDTINPEDLVYLDRVKEAIHHADTIIQGRSIN